MVWRSGSHPMPVVGESHCQTALQEICGPHNRHGHDKTFAAAIEREPSNPYDPNAVVVRVLGRKVGYLPRPQAERVSQQMDSVGISMADCEARIRGGWRTNQHDEGCFGVTLAIPQRGQINFGIGANPVEA